jgi:phosphate transport system substrate-binding protein
VGQTKGAIGYIGWAYETKQIAVSYDQGKTFIEPSVARSARDKTRIQLLDILHVRQEKCCKSKTVVDYALSPEGQKNC